MKKFWKINANREIEDTFPHTVTYVVEVGRLFGETIAELMKYDQKRAIEIYEAFKGLSNKKGEVK